jgi:hypothetical protein
MQLHERTPMKSTIRLPNLLLELTLGALLLAALAPDSQAQTANRKSLISTSPAIFISQSSAEDFYKQGNSLYK